MRPRTLPLLLAATCLLARAAPAQDEPQDPQKVRAKFAQLEQAVAALFREKAYAEAAAKCKEQMELLPDDPGPYYNLACALARMGKKEAALKALSSSVDLGFSQADHMAVDEDLASLHEEKGFQGILAKARAAQKKAFAKLYQKGAEIPGVKTLEGDPKDGLRWRLRMPKDATPEKPARLLVWLHPSGGSMNRRIEALSPQFAAKGWALLVPTQKQWTGWSGEEAKKLMDVTLPDVAKTPGIDAKRPVLMGFSAGGQMALMLYDKDPSRFSGIVLDAAYPIDTALYDKSRQIAVKPPPEGDVVKKVPFFVLVGAADGGSRLWREAKGPWRKAGVPLTIQYVPEGKHEWLFHEKQIAELLDWLGGLGSMPKPGAEPAKNK